MKERSIRSQGATSRIGVFYPAHHTLPTRLGFVAIMVAQMKRDGWPFEAAFDVARSNLADFLDQSRIEYGDPAYGWTVGDAIHLAKEYRYG